MASSVYEDDDESNHSLGSFSCSSESCYDFKNRSSSPENEPARNSSRTANKNFNILHKLTNRQMYGRVTWTSKSKTESFFDHVHSKCRMKIDDLIEERQEYHIYMGFTLCGRYFITYKEVLVDLTSIFPSVEYELYVWRFVSGRSLIYVCKHRIFKLLKGPELDDITFVQYPTDPNKLYCYGAGGRVNPGVSYLTILTLPNLGNCFYCKENVRQIDDSLAQGWCLTHGFMLHYMFAMSQPGPKFDPRVSFAFPDHLVINTGHYIHILSVSCYRPTPPPLLPFNSLPRDEEMKPSGCSFPDTVSEISEAASDNFSANSVIEAILEDFSEYDLEGSDCTKPFHELNISCEPLNVTGKSYHNTLVQNIVDPRLKRLQNKDYFFSLPHNSGTQKNLDKPKIDRKIAEKAYEFIEENEKCEKLSSFRKKRLADKKYEFSEDNSENIVPFNSLRRERRFSCRTKGKSPEFSGLFLSPRSPGIRSPMQSPNSRHGQFSPANRNLYGLRNSPHHSKSPISPRESARKFNVYSPSLDSDCSDYDSKLILRQIHNFHSSNSNDNRIPPPSGLLIVDSKKEESAKWIKKVVRRYSSVDFETSSLVSGQSRDDYNTPIEIPTIVQTLTDQHLDIVPEFKSDQTLETQLLVTQRSFDCEQFVQLRAQRLCAEEELEFLHCEDYDIKLLHICPLDGHIICQAVIKIGALNVREPSGRPKPRMYVTRCLFVWNIETDAFEVIEPLTAQPDGAKLQLAVAGAAALQPLHIDIPRINARPLLIMDLDNDSSKLTLRDYHDNYEIVSDYFITNLSDRNESLDVSFSSDSDLMV